MAAAEPVRPDRAPVHYLRPNDRVWTPPSVMFMDSETRTDTMGDVELLQLRLWVAKLVDRREVRKRTGPEQWADGTTPGSLADQVAAWTRGRRSLWVYAHNLGFDLVTTALPVHLTRMGWKVTEYALRSQSPWMRLSDGRSTITLVDSWSFVAAALADVAAAYGDVKEDLPAEDDPHDRWHARCHKDVELLATAMCDLMDWWDRNRLGRWTISGAASGWNAYRHRPSRYRVLVDPDPAQLAADRLAIRGGRRDVTRVGDMGRGDFVEVDFVAAHATVCANLPLPYRRGATFDTIPTDHPAITGDRWGVIAECHLHTETPRYPVRIGGVTWYPVGDFRTVLASPEAAWAADNGDLVSVGPGQFHQLGWALVDWANWILDVTSGADPDSPPIARMAAKMWGRTVPGKWAGRGQERQDLGVSPDDGWSYLDGWDHDRQCHGALVNMCGQVSWNTFDVETENTYPAILAFVESHVRARLGRLLEAMPPGSWVSCDTDGVMIDATRITPWVREHLSVKHRTRDGWGVLAELCTKLEPVTWPLVARPKRAHGHLRTLGPQHYVTDQDRRLSGVRRDAVETEPNRFVARDWPSLRWQMNHSRPGVYARPPRTVTLAKPLAHGWITEDGTVWPVWCRIGDDGSNQLVPWSESWGPHVTTPLATMQYDGLSRLH